MKFKPLLYILIAFISLASCQNEKSRYTELKINKGKFEIILDKEGKVANPGEYIIYSVLFKDDKGKVFMDKRKSKELLREQVVKDSVFLKDLTPVSEVLYQMSIGDSANIIVPLLDDQKVGDMKQSDTLFFHLNVKNIVDKEGMRDIIEDEFLKQEAEETEARIKQIEVDQIIMKTWDEFNKGKLKGKLKRTKNGVKYIVIRDGKGEKAKERQRVKIGYYGMTHKEANAFDNSFRRDKDLEVVIGANQVITGWDEALKEMNTGMKAVFFIPSKLAFGKNGKNAIIPPNADLVFYIELHEIIK